MIPDDVLTRARDAELVAGEEIQVHPGGEIAQRVWLADVDRGHSGPMCLRVVCQAETWEEMVWPK